MTQPRPPSIWRRAVLSAVVTIGVLVGGELGLALFDVSDSKLYAGDPGWYWTLHADLDLPEVDHREQGTTFSVRTSSDGLRDEEWPSSASTVLALGCSTTFGWGVEAAESWPAQLEARLGVPVVNAGVPGHSSHQGRRFASPLIDRDPALAIIAWGIRDAEGAARFDHQARPATFPRSTRLYRLLRNLLPRRARARSVPRVSPEDLADNLHAVVSQALARGVAVVLLDFPSQQPSVAHQAALRAVSGKLGVPLLAPTLPADLFFEHDPIHLRAAGHQRVADVLEAPVRAVLNPGS